MRVLPLNLGVEAPAAELLLLLLKSWGARTISSGPILVLVDSKGSNAKRLQPAFLFVTMTTSDLFNSYFYWLWIRP